MDRGEHRMGRLDDCQRGLHASVVPGVQERIL